MSGYSFGGRGRGGGGWRGGGPPSGGYGHDRGQQVPWEQLKCKVIGPNPLIKHAVTNISSFVLSVFQ